MHNNIEKLNEQQKEQLLLAILELADGEPSMLLEDLDHLFFMALEAEFMNGREFRSGQTLTFLHLHNFLAKLEMIYHKKAGCHLLAM